MDRGGGGGGWGAAVLVTLGIILTSRLVLWALERAADTWQSRTAPDAATPVWAQTTSGAFWAVAIITCGLIEAAIVVAWVRLARKGCWHAALAARKVPARDLAFWVTLMVGFAVGCDAVTWLANRPIVPDPMVEAYRTAGWTPMFWLALVGVAPLVEEGVFRGLLFGGVEASLLGRRGAIALSTLLWAATHGQYDAWGLGIVLGAGALLGWARASSGSTVVTWMMHTLWNAFAVTEAMLFAT